MSKTITVSELSDLLIQDPSLQMIDVRSHGEYAAGHVPRALNIPLEQVDSRLDDLGGRVAILCQSGRRASMACELLNAHHDDLLVVEGGTQAWIDAGKPITASTGTARWALERQVRLAAGILALAGTILAITVNPSWIYLAMFVGAGLIFAGLTNFCPMASILASLPWNKPRNSRPEAEVRS